MLIVAYPRFTSSWKNNLVKSLVGLLLLVPTWLAFTHLHQMEQGEWLILYLFLLVWGADSGAYFVGKRFGRRKLMPMVSPAKSWAGIGGAVMVVSVLALLVHHYFAPPVSSLWVF